MHSSRPSSASALLCAAAFCLAAVPGVRAADQPTPVPSPAAATATPAAADLAPLAPPTPEILADVAAHARSGDDLWAYIKKYSGTDDLTGIDPSLDQEAKMTKAREIIRDKVAHLRPAVDELLKRYPQDAHRWDAKLMRVIFSKEENSISEEDADKAFHEIADAPDASVDSKRQARGALLQETLEKADPLSGLTPEIEKQLAAYEKDFADDPVGEQFVGLRLKLLQFTPSKINAVLAGLAKSPNKATADAAAQQLALRTTPVDLKFTTLDGKEIDFAKLRGKVVLIDCWATWCVPCIVKLPELQALNQKFKDKDFQMVGVSLDDDKAEVEKFVKSKNITWPQYCDAKVWKNEVSAHFGVTDLPAAFLVDKQGLAHPVDPDADLDAEIGKLLAVGSKE